MFVKTGDAEIVGVIKTSEEEEDKAKKLLDKAKKEANNTTPKKDVKNAN